jgi:ankyrin repeat protein
MIPRELMMHGNTALHVAVTAVPEDILALLKMLLTDNANAFSQNNDGNTPLHLAVSAALNDPNSVEIVTALLDVDADLSAKNDKGNTPLHLAAFRAPNLETIGIEILKIFSSANADLSV